MKNKISVTIICKNEASRIKRCLDSVCWADEIVIVDSGSTDDTLAVVAEYTDKIFINTDWQGFGKQKTLMLHWKSSLSFVFTPNHILNFHRLCEKGAATTDEAILLYGYKYS